MRVVEACPSRVQTLDQPLAWGIQVAPRHEPAADVAVDKPGQFGFGKPILLDNAFENEVARFQISRAAGGRHAAVGRGAVGNDDARAADDGVNPLDPGKLGPVPLTKNLAVAGDALEEVLPGGGDIRVREKKPRQVGRHADQTGLVGVILRVDGFAKVRGQARGRVRHLPQVHEMDGIAAQWNNLGRLRHFGSGRIQAAGELGNGALHASPPQNANNPGPS